MGLRLYLVFDLWALTCIAIEGRVFLCPITYHQDGTQTSKQNSENEFLATRNFHYEPTIDRTIYHLLLIAAHESNMELSDFSEGCGLIILPPPALAICQSLCHIRACVWSIVKCHRFLDLQRDIAR